jgi:hypothetical protein
MEYFTEVINLLCGWAGPMTSLKMAMALLLVMLAVVSLAADLIQIESWVRSLTSSSGTSSAVTRMTGPSQRLRTVVTPNGSTTTIVVVPAVRETCGAADAEPEVIEACGRALNRDR